METPPQLYKFHISLLDVEPMIWRRVTIPVKWRLNKVSMALMIAMGWTNSHLHEIEYKNVIYLDCPEESEELEDEFTYIKESKKRLIELELKPGDSFSFRYDFGDGWEHKVTMEGTAEIPSPQIKPRANCLEGARACPPEDCGGTRGYESLLSTLKDKNHPEYNEMMEWLGGHFDPEFFDIKKTREQLRSYSDCPSMFTSPDLFE